MTVQPRDRSVSIAASPAADGADPPDWSNTRVPADIPDVTSDTRMLSMLVWVSAVFVNASLKFPPLTLSKALAGKLVRLVQSRHARSKVVPEDVSMSGKLVRLEQPNQASAKLVPEDVSIKGKLVRLEQPSQAIAKSVPEDVSMSGKLVISDQFLQKLLKLVTAP